MPMAWYVVHTYSGYENKAKAALEDAIRRAGMEHKFGDPLENSVLVPTEQIVEVKEGKKRTMTRKVYPGYMFVQMDADQTSLHLVRSTPDARG
jgi:transcriptional antiterminator NusG